MAEEIWALLGHTQTLAYEQWPIYDPLLVEDAMLEIPVMINGRVRTVLNVPTASTEADVEKLAMSDAKVQEHLSGKTIKQKKYVPKKIYTIVVA